MKIDYNRINVGNHKITENYRKLENQKFPSIEKNSELWHHKIPFIDLSPRRLSRIDKKMWGLYPIGAFIRWEAIISDSPWFWEVIPRRRHLDGIRYLSNTTRDLSSVWFQTLVVSFYVHFDDCSADNQAKVLWCTIEYHSTIEAWYSREMYQNSCSDWISSHSDPIKPHRLSIIHNRSSSSSQSVLWFTLLLHSSPLS